MTIVSINSLVNYKPSEIQALPALIKSEKTEDTQIKKKWQKMIL